MCLQKSAAASAAHRCGSSQVPIVKLSSLRLTARLLIIIFLFLQFFASLSSSNRHHFSSGSQLQPLTLPPLSSSSSPPSPPARNYHQTAAASVSLIGSHQQSKSPSSSKAVLSTNSWYFQRKFVPLPFPLFQVDRKHHCLSVYFCSTCCKKRSQQCTVLNSTSE